MSMTTRDCDCDHPFPFCACALGYVGETLAYHSRIASAIIGWPTRDYDQDALADHNAKMAAARTERDRILAMDSGGEAIRATKPRVALGVDQSTMPPVDCVPCQETK